MEHTTSANIHEIQPGAVYEGVVYDQTVVADLDDGTTIEFFDPTITSISEEMIGKKVAIVLFAQVSDIRPSRNSECGIAVNGDDYIIRGRISNKSVTNDWFPDEKAELTEVDFGIGNVLVNPEEVTTFEIGDCVTIHAFRLDIIDVMNN